MPGEVDQRIPVFLMTGFLGVGKTTVLNQLLKRPELKNSLVVVNEFGEAGFDHLVVEGSKENLIALSNGCMCCQVRDDFSAGLVSMMDREHERVFIETSGIADPLPIMQVFAAHPQLSSRYWFDVCVCLFDLVRGGALITAHPEAERQLALADIVLFTKQDLIEPSLRARKLTDAQEFVAMINQPVKRLVWEGSETDVFALLEPGEESRAYSDLTLKRLHESRTPFATFLLETEQSFPAARIHDFLDRLLAVHGDRVLRIKGFAQVEEHPEAPLLVQTSGKILHAPAKLSNWPEGICGTKLSVITDGLGADQVGKLFDAFFDRGGIDTADHDAMMNNPLAIPGMAPPTKS